MISQFGVFLKDAFGCLQGGGGGDLTCDLLITEMSL